MSKLMHEPVVGRVDSKGRLTLGSWAVGKTFQVEQTGEGEYRLTAMMMVPEREAWLFNNAEALSMVKDGLQQSARGEVVKIDLTQFPDDGQE